MALNYDSLAESYHFLFTELADPRTNVWLGVGSPIYPLGLSAVYLLLVFNCVPKFMQNRPAYKLEGFIILYNVYQVIACTLFAYGVITSGWTTTYSWVCQLVDRSNSPEAMTMASCCWWLYFIKATEFIETVVFSLRKKQNQITFLHVYHHVSSLLLAWALVKYLPGGAYTFPPLLNSFIHIAMYIYYLLALFKAPWLQKVLFKVKPYITISQMVQFALMLVYLVHSFIRCECNVTIVSIFLVNVVIVFYMFYDFYQKSYSRPSKKKT